MRPFLWNTLGRLAFRCTIQNQYALRRRILRAFGATIGNTTRFRPSVVIERPWLLTVGELTICGDHAQLIGPERISIGARCVVSQYAILATAIADPDSPTHADRAAPITMEDDTWVAADSLVLPGAVIRRGTVVGARSLVQGELPEWRIATGEPAAPRRSREFKEQPL
ncbi:MAG: colanic acid biosynthesis acetyltransferase WcaF [Phycisphaerales bacterium]|nr:colanic acid biosynthesis acetyltransferase WcaF [Phycisphaerales bacterium]